MIVKVQLSLATNAGARQVLVYDQGRTIRYEGTTSAELLEAMEERARGFFDAALIPGPDPYLHLNFTNPLPEQGW